MKISTGCDFAETAVSRRTVLHRRTITGDLCASHRRAATHLEREGTPSDRGVDPQTRIRTTLCIPPDIGSAESRPNTR
jgi:hypothetical protein